MSIGSRLQKRTQDLGMKQNEIAKKMNISTTTLNGYYKDYREPDIATLCRLAEILETHVEYIIGSSDIPVVPSPTKKSAAESLGDEIMKMFIDAGRLTPGETLTDELREYATGLVRAAVALEQRRDVK